METPKPRLKTYSQKINLFASKGSGEDVNIFKRNGLWVFKTKINL